MFCAGLFSICRSFSCVCIGTRKQPWWPFFAIVAFQGVPGKRRLEPAFAPGNARILLGMKSAGQKATADVPMLDLSRQYASIREEVLAAVARACDSQRYILGDEVVAFEREFAALCGTADSVGCASGTDGLWLALAATGVGPGDSVITTPFSFFATASSILRAGAKPIFVDVDPGTLNLDPAKVEDLLKRSPRGMRAVMPVHLYGQCADMDAFSRIAAEFKVHVVEDAAQAVGATWNG